MDLQDAGFILPQTNLNQMNKYQSFLILLVLPFLFFACEPNQNEESKSWESDNNKTPGQMLDDAIESTKSSINDAQEKHNKKSVHFSDLKEVLPSSIGSFDKTDSEGESTAVFGFNISTASATYEDGDGKIKMKVSDIGGFSGIVESLAPWAKVEFDRENSNGYERTTIIEGHKGKKSYDRNLRSGEIFIFVGNRFIVEIEGNNVDESDLEKALRKFDLDDLEDFLGE
jgi:hypothetical protein